MDVKKLMANLVSRGLSRGNKPSKYIRSVLKQRCPLHVCHPSRSCHFVQFSTVRCVQNFRQQPTTSRGSCSSRFGFVFKQRINFFCFLPELAQSAEKSTHSSLSLLLSLASPMNSHSSWKRTLMKIRLDDVVSSSFSLMCCRI